MVRHEQGAAYMALGAALATGKPAVYSVVPGAGFLNSTAALAREGIAHPDVPRRMFEEFYSLSAQ